MNGHKRQPPAYLLRKIGSEPTTCKFYEGKVLMGIFIAWCWGFLGAFDSFAFTRSFVNSLA